jgi:Zn-dependent peptidase ImmA (M78 family)
VTDEISLADDASRLLEVAGRETPPVDVGRLAELLGTRVYSVEFKSPDLVSSASRNPHGETRIFVDASLSPEWKRVAVAKELARLILERADDRQSEPSVASVSRLANELLMPRGLVSSMWPLIRDERELAHIFYVPDTVMNSRITELGL